MTESDVDGNIQDIACQEMWEHIGMEGMAHHKHHGCGIDHIKSAERHVELPHVSQ